MMTGAGPQQEMELINVFRHVILTGALMGFARYIAKDLRLMP